MASEQSAPDAAPTFSFADCDWVGFDLDHTLVRYHQELLDSMVARSITRFLVSHKHYPEELIDQLETDGQFMREFSCKGLVVDKASGNVLQLDSKKMPIRGYHGREAISSSELARLYPEPLAYEGVTTAELIGIVTAFERACAPLFALLVERRDRGDLGPHSELPYEHIMDHIIDSVYFNYAQGKESYFASMIREGLNDCIFERPRLRQWLQRVRDNGVRVFLLTNSKLDYTRLLADRAFGRDWTDMFDLCLFYGRKPHFFLKEEPFVEVDFDGAHDFKVVQENVTKLEKGKLYSNGNYKQLLSYLEEHRPQHRDPAKPVEVCYVGDHLMSDVFVPRNAMRLHTVAIVEELEAFHISHAGSEPHLLGHELKLPHNKYWGSFFHGPGDVPTYWQNQIQQYATLCVPCLSHFFEHDVDHKYECNKEHVMHPCTVLQKPIPSYTLYYKRPDTSEI